MRLSMMLSRSFHYVSAHNELSPRVKKGDNSLYGTNIELGDEFVWRNVLGDEFVWDEFVGDKLLGEES